MIFLNNFASSDHQCASEYCGGLFSAAESEIGMGMAPDSVFHSGAGIRVLSAVGCGYA